MSDAMNKDHFTQDLLDLAVAGLLEPGQHETTYAHASNCSACEAKLQEAMAHRARILARGVPQRQESGELGFAAPKQRLRVVPISARVAFVGALAASILLAVFLLRPDDTPGDLYWMPKSTGLTISRSATAPRQELVDAVDLYEQRDPQAVRRLLEGLEVQVEYRDLHALYLASAYLNLGVPERALESLPAARNLPSHRAGQVKWIRYMALTATGRNTEADQLLAVLAERKDAIGAMARERLNAP